MAGDRGDRGDTLIVSDAEGVIGDGGSTMALFSINRAKPADCL